MADRVGQQFGNYRLMRLLGQGGFAEVYLGEHIYLNTQAAVKVLQTQLAKDQTEHFRTEARTIARLEHPHIVRVLEFGIENDTPFLVMAYAPNGTVREQHPRGVPVPLTVIVQYVQQIGDALQYAHDEKVIHRDIKPENVLLGRRREVLLSDFGIATLAQSSRKTMQEVVGTVSYMAPEQLKGKPCPASDQYSLGVVVYEWLSGTCPFTGTFTEVASQQIFAAPPPLHSKVPTISPEIERVVMTALAKDPQERFVTVWAFAKALEQVCGPLPPDQSPIAINPDQAILPTFISRGPNQPSQTPSVGAFKDARINSPSTLDDPEAATGLDESMFPTIVSSRPNRTPLPPVVMTPTPPIQPPQSFGLPYTGSQATPSPREGFSRRTVLIGLAGLAVGIVGGAAVLALLPKSPVTPLPIPTSIPPLAPGTPTTVPATSAAPSATPPPSAPALGTTFTTYHGHSSYVYGVSWVSSDGQRVASASFDKTVQVWNATSGSKYFSYNHTNAVNDVKSSRDGTRIASAGEDAIAQVRDAATGTQLATYSGHRGAVNTVQWVSDGTRIVSSSTDTTAQVWNANSGSNLVTYRGHTARVWAAAWSPDGQRIASAGDDKTVQVWDANSGSHLLTYSGHGATVRSVSWSSDGQRIASASEDRTVQVWNASTGATILTYRGHADLLRTVSWSHDGTRIVSGSKDGTAQIWDANSGGTIFIYRGHSSTVFDAEWSPDDGRIASGGTDTTVRVWQAR